MSLEAKISISIIEGKIEFSGSEEFVKSQIDHFKPIIDKILDSSSNKPNVEVSPKAKKTLELVTATNPAEENNSSMDFSDVFMVDNDKIRIIPDIPGKSNSEKTLKVAILLAFAAKQLQGRDEIGIEEVRAVCINHGNLDKKNFSMHIRNGDPKFYLDKKNGNHRLIKLIKPGKKKALELIKEMR